MDNAKSASTHVSSTSSNTNEQMEGLGDGDRNNTGKKKKKRHNKKKTGGVGTTNGSNSGNTSNNTDISVKPSSSKSMNFAAVPSTEVKRTGGGFAGRGGGRRRRGDNKNSKSIENNSNSSNNNNKSNNKNGNKNNKNKSESSNSAENNNNNNNNINDINDINISDRNGNDNKNNKDNKDNKDNKNNKNNKNKNVKNDKDKRHVPSENVGKGKRKAGNKNNRRSLQKILYPAYHDLRQCLDRIAADDPKLIRGKIRVVPGGKSAFVSCDRGRFVRDVFLEGEKGRNRALNGDIVFVEIIGSGGGEGGVEGEVMDCHGKVVEASNMLVLGNLMQGVDIEETEVALRHVAEDAVTKDNVCEEKVAGTDDQYMTDVQYDDYEISDDHHHHHQQQQQHKHNQYDGNNDEKSEGRVEESGSIESNWDGEMWQDDEIQASLWNPLVNTRKPAPLSKLSSKETSDDKEQPTGVVVHVLPPKLSLSEINPTNKRHLTVSPRKTIVGTLMSLPGANNCRLLLVPTNRSLPRFMTPTGTKAKLAKDRDKDESKYGDDDSTKPDNTLYCAEYIHGSWSPTDKWPPCSNLKAMGTAGNVEDETIALLTEFEVEYGPFPPKALQDVEDVVESGRIQTADGDMGWAPTPEMLVGRRDFRSHRIFTIDPTTAKDLDDALHVKDLGDGRVEIGVHIADCSYFVKAGSAIDKEAAQRGTTVYLVDRTVPMLPRPLCEIACSLNENVERLAFSCVWTMNKDGNLRDDGKEKPEEVWYGRSVIRSCARLDYATAQNIIDGKVANGETNQGEVIDETYWPVERQPTGGHTIDGVADDVRLMHKVAMARRKLRFENGALSLNGVKLTFQLEEDGETPEMCAPYPIRDSNRLIEEYMLLANFLVAQRMITHAGGLAQLRRHPPPLMTGIQEAVDIARVAGFDIDASSSQTLQASINKLGRECTDTLVIQCVTATLTLPMQQALYFAAGSLNEEEWCHFALHIPYYTHFTSPIRRYPDIIVHRVLQATIDGEDSVKKFVHSEQEIGGMSTHCNEKKENSRKAQERSDRIFLSIYLKTNPIPSAFAVVTSVGTKTFTVFVPSLGLNTKIFLDDHSEKYNVTVNEGSNGCNSIILNPKVGVDGPSRLDIKIFSKIAVSCNCKDTAPIDVSLRIVGPWVET